MVIEEYALDCLGAALLDDSMVIEAVSDGVVGISGHSRETLIGTHGLSLVHPDDSERAGEAMLELVRTQLPTVNGIYRMRLSDDAYEDYAIQALTYTDDGSVKTVLKFSAVSLVLRADEFARDAVDTLRLLGEGRQLNDCLERVHHLAERHIPGTHLAISTVQGGEVWTHRRASGRAFCWEQPAQVRPPNIERALANHLTGPWRAFSSMAEFEPTANGALITSVLTDDANELLGYVEATRESVAEPDEREWMVHGLVRQVLTAVLRRVRLDEQLRHAADHDPLTGLANRRRLFNDMAAADDMAGTSLLLIDLDRFSWINNNLGHDVGDRGTSGGRRPPPRVVPHRIHDYPLRWRRVRCMVSGSVERPRRPLSSVAFSEDHALRHRGSSVLATKFYRRNNYSTRRNCGRSHQTG